MIELKLFNSSGVVTAIAPDWSNIAFTDKLNDEGTVTVKYAKLGLNYSQLATAGTEGGLFLLDGTEIPNSRFVVSERRGERVAIDTDEDVQGVTWLSRLKEAIVYPPSWPSTTTADYTFSNATAGAIMDTLLDAAYARGVQAVTQSSWSFTNLIDSRGSGWTKQVSIGFKAGTTLLEVLRGLVKLGLCGVETVGRQIRLYDTGRGTDRTTGGTIVTLYSGRDLADAPKNTTARDLMSAVLVAGDNNSMVEVTDSTAIAQWGRREAYVSQSGVADNGTLTVIGQTTIDINDHERMELSHKLTMASDGPLPFVNYFVGDTIFTDVVGTPEPYTVTQLSITWGQTEVSGAITLNDSFDALEVKLTRQLESFSDVVVSPNTPTDDLLAPGKVTGVSLSSAAYQDTVQGVTYAQVTASWNPVTTNEDGSAINDLDHYIVQWRRSSTSVWQIAGVANGPGLSWSPMPTGQSIDVIVAAVDNDGHIGQYSDVVQIITDDDAGAPPTPSTPSVVPYLGTLRIIWDGLGSVGQAMPSDLAWVEVHLSTVNNFTPSTSTLVDTLPSKAVSVITNLTYGTTYYAKLVAVDRTGNRSGTSAQASGAPSQVVTGDVGDGVITNAKIANLAVNDAKIGSVSAGKITAGTLSADVVLGARIKTADTGARVELNSGGIGVWNSANIQTVGIAQSDGSFFLRSNSSGARIELRTTGITAYNSSGTQTVNIDASNGNATFIGEVRTAASGRRLVFNPGGNSPEIRFYNTDASRYVQLYSYDPAGNGKPELKIRSATDPSTSYYSEIHVGDLAIDATVYNASNNRVAQMQVLGSGYVVLLGDYNVFENNPWIVAGKANVSGTAGTVFYGVTYQKTPAPAVTVRAGNVAAFVVGGIAPDNFQWQFGGPSLSNFADHLNWCGVRV